MDDLPPKDYWEKRLKENFGLHGTGYIGLGKHYNNWMYKIRRKVLLRKMRSLHMDFANLHVLDVGSGVGFYIDVWKELGARRIVGTDITNMAINNLKLKYPMEEFYQVDIGDERIECLGNRTYDIVSAFDVLYHIVDDNRYSKAINNIHSLLRPKGFFVFSENFLHGNATRSTYQVSRRLSVIEKILIENGFEIVERCPMFFLMNNPIDTTHSAMRGLWKFITASIRRFGNTAGLVVGGILYPLESVFVASMKESPTTEMMICKRLD